MSNTQKLICFEVLIACINRPCLLYALSVMWATYVTCHMLSIIQFYPGKRRRLTCDAVQFSTDPQLSDKDCYFYLNKYMADHVSEGNKTLQMLFIR